MPTIKMPSSTDVAMLMLLDQRFGDGLVHLYDRDDELLRDEAVRLGLVAEGGYVTTGGNLLTAMRMMPLCDDSTPS